MNVQDFLVKWHHPNGQQNPKIEQLDIRLLPWSVFDSSPTDRIRFEIESVVVTKDNLRIYLKEESEEFGDKPASDALEHLIDKLDGELRRQIDDSHRLSQGVKRERPALTVIAGAGFSKPFGLPVTADINGLAKQPCHNPDSHFEELFPCPHEMYPLKEFFEGDCRFLDFESFLTLWEGYRHQLQFCPDSPLEEHKQCYRYFIQNICCHLYKRCWEIRELQTYRERLLAMAAWLKEAQQKFDVRVVTFNYDVIWEMICREAGFKFTYTESADASTIPIWKLHGSINWQEIPNALTQQDWQPVYTGAGMHVRSLMDMEKAPLDGSGEVPVLIPPIAAKSYKGVYNWMWSFAARDIERADKLIVVGYSLPPLDAFSQFQLRRLLRGRAKPVRYVVSGNHEDRIRRALHGVELEFFSEHWEPQHFASLLE